MKFQAARLALGGGRYLGTGGHFDMHQAVPVHVGGSDIGPLTENGLDRQFDAGIEVSLALEGRRRIARALPEEPRRAGVLRGRIDRMVEVDRQPIVRPLALTIIVIVGPGGRQTPGLERDAHRKDGGYGGSTQVSKRT